MPKILIFDDFLSQEEQDSIENYLLSPGFLWSYFPDTVSPDNGSFSDKNIKDNSQLSYSFVTDGNFNHINSNDIVSLIVNRLRQKHGIDAMDLRRCKANLNFPVPNYLQSYYKPPHYDDMEYLSGNVSLMVGLYYVSDSDGSTIIFEDYKQEDGSFKIMHSFEPKKGRMICFDNKCLHSSQPPFLSKHRCVINFNFKNKLCQ